MHAARQCVLAFSTGDMRAPGLLLLLLLAVVGAVVLAGAVAGLVCFRRKQRSRSYCNTKDTLIQPDLEAGSQCCDVGASKDRCASAIQPRPSQE
jgi:hypothetical protein